MINSELNQGGLDKIKTYISNKTFLKNAIEVYNYICNYMI